MPLVTMKEVLKESLEGKYAVGAFDSLDPVSYPHLVLHCGVFRWSEKLHTVKQINHLLGVVEVASAYSIKPPFL